MITQQVQQRYLNFPVKNGATKRQVSVLAGGQLLHDFVIELAEGDPDFWAILDLKDTIGKEIVLQIFPPLNETHPVEPFIQSDRIIGSEELYHERLRPQFHFTARRGWLNDPNGLVYNNGVYHLFFQHNPYGTAWGNMHWGHATSPDLVHWQEEPEALYPDALGTMFSGSAVIDWENTSGFRQGDQPPLVLIYTAAGDTSAWSKDQPFTQCLAYSTDGGETFTKYPGNPVLPCVRPGNRDPKVIWHALSRRWVMALYLDEADFALFTSPDLKNWQQTDSFSIPDCMECPDFFELPVDGNPADTRWVLWGANASYLIGRFDGERYSVEEQVLKSQHTGSAYAAQTYSDIPAADGRRIQFAWLRGDIPGMPFNQQMTFPVSLSLRKTAAGIRLCSQPVKEIERLHGACHVFDPQPLRPEGNPLAGLELDTCDLHLEIDPAQAAEVGLNIHGVEIAYNAAAQTLSCLGRTAPLQPVNGIIQLQILVDRASLEIFANQGELYLPFSVIYPAGNQTLEVFARGGEAQICSLEVFEMQPAWEGQTASGGSR